MHAFWTLTIPVPAWLALTFALLAFGWQWIMERQMKYLRALYEAYWQRAEYDDESDDDTGPAPKGRSE